MTRRVAIVGPVSPFRSGIAKHTTEVAAQIARRDDMALTVISFSRQYPPLLYPGENDRDESTPPPEGIDVTELLDSINPLTWRRAVDRIVAFKPDLVVMPAWTFFLAPCFGWVAARCKARGIPVVMIVHNVVDHEAASWKGGLMRYQLRHADRFITHGAALAKELRGYVQNQPIDVRPHPIYDQYPPAKGTLARRAPLELLFFGLVRDYKGLDIALRGLAASGRTDVRLSVVGEFWEGRQETEDLVTKLGIADRVDIEPRYVSDAEAAEVFQRADIVVLPYRSVTGSGVVPVAYRYGKPVIVSDLPGLTEVVTAGKTGWVVPPEDAEALGRLLASLDAEQAAAMAPAIAEARKEMSWPVFVDALLASA